MRTAGTILNTSAGPVEHIVEGAQNGIPVVVLHGSPGGIDAADIMSTFLPRERFRIVLISRPGYLGSALGDRRTADQQADLIPAILDALDIDRAAAFAWSGSGPMAYRFAVRHPSRAIAIVADAAVSEAIAVPAQGMAARLMFDTPVGNWLMRYLVAHKPDTIVDSTLSSEGHLEPEVLEQRVADVLADETKRRFVLDLATTVNQNGARKPGYDSDCQMFANLPDLELERITSPTLIIHGSADADLPPAQSYHAATRIPHARVRILEAGTHLALWTHPDADAAQAEVIDFLATSASTASQSASPPDAARIFPSTIKDPA